MEAGTLEALPGILTSLRVGLMLGASTAMCENSFSAVRNVFTDNHQAHHAHNA